MEPQTRNKGVENFLVVLALFLFVLGIFIGSEIWRVDPEERIAVLMSCNEYEEDFLKFMGFDTREACKRINRALYEQFASQCLEKVGSGLTEKQHLRLQNQCIWHEFEISTIEIINARTRFLTNNS